MRSKGRIPAVIYGHKQAVVPITVARDDVWRMIKTPGHLADLDLGDTTETVLIREVQWDNLGKEVLHLDFSRVSAEEIIETEVSLEVRGQAAGIANGGVLEQVVHRLSIKCRAGAIPDSIKVDISHLQIDEGIHVRDLVLPPDVTVMPTQICCCCMWSCVERKKSRSLPRRKKPHNPKSSNPSARKKTRKIEWGRSRLLLRLALPA